MKILRILFKLIVLCFLLLLITGTVLYFIASPQLEIPPTATGDAIITLGGNSFHYETHGDSSNEVIIVLHGGPGNDYRYLLDLKALSDSFYVVLYDQRGTGLSPRVPKEELTLETSLADLDLFVDHFGNGKKVHLIGHSWGAMLASKYTADNPTKVGRIAMAEPGMLTSEMGEKYRELFQIKPTWPILKTLIMAFFESRKIQEIDGQERGDYIFARIGLSDLPDNPMLKYFCNEDITTAKIPFWRFSALSSIAIQSGGVVDGKISLDLVSGIEKYQDTVLFITSECNQIIGAAFQEGHIKHFPKARHEIIPSAGHSMIGEKPEIVLPLIREFLKITP